MASSPAAAGPSGFSLLESLIALSLFLFLILAGIGIFNSARGTLFKLEEAQAAEESVAAAIERIRADVRSAGFGLAGPPGVEIVSSLESGSQSLVVRDGEAETGLAADAAAGQSELAVVDGRAFSSGRTVCILDGEKGQSALITAAAAAGGALAAPLTGSYARSGTRVVLVRTITLYMDAARSVLRRKVDAGAGQPLLEDARSFDVAISTPSPLVTVAVRSRLGRGDTRAAAFHAPNAFLAGRR